MAAIRRGGEPEREEVARMQNARKYNERITIGAVPGADDLEQLKRLGYGLVIDVRDEQERFGGAVEKAASRAGLRYVALPVTCEAIKLSDVKRFYELCTEAEPPIYAFSRFGKRPLAMLLLFDAIAAERPIHSVFREAMRFGLSLEGDLTLRAFVVDAMNSGELKPVVESLAERWPALARRPPPAPDEADADDIQTSLAEALRLWSSTHDRAALLGTLRQLTRRLEG